MWNGALGHHLFPQQTDPVRAQKEGPLMLRRTRRLPKFKTLVRRLGGAEYRAVGVLEALWHVTAEVMPDGAIGRLSDEEIEVAIGWDQEPGTLVRMLCETKWLDALDASQGRLFVHDWHDWADESVHRTLVRAETPFANSAPPRTTRCTSEERKAHEEFIKTCAPSAHAGPTKGARRAREASGQRPEKNKKNTAAATRRPRRGSDNADPRFEAFWAAFPTRAGDNPKRRAKNAWNARLAEGATVDEIIAGTKRYAAYVQARGTAATQFVKQAVSFLGPDCAFRESWSTNGVGERYVPNHPLYRKPGEFVG
jgi:hypothetical protein